MSYDIYGNPLRRGHCEVHPHVHEEYPCSVCIQESNNRNAHKQSESDHCKIMELERALGLSQQRIAELEAERDSVCHLNDALSLERDALAAALSLAKQMFHDYEMEVDCPAPTKHRHKMDRMYAALAEHDAEVARKAYEQAAIDFGFAGMANIVTEHANEYANRLKRGA